MFTSQYPITVLTPGSILTKRDSALLRPRRPPSLRLPSPRQLENGRDRRTGYLPSGIRTRRWSIRTDDLARIAYGDQSVRIFDEFRRPVVVRHGSSAGFGGSLES